MTCVGWGELSHAYTAPSIAKMCTYMTESLTANCVSRCFLLSMTVCGETWHLYAKKNKVPLAHVVLQTTCRYRNEKGVRSRKNTARQHMFDFTADLIVGLWILRSFPFDGPSLSSAQTRHGGDTRGQRETQGRRLAVIGWWMILKGKSDVFYDLLVFRIPAQSEARILTGSRYLK